MSMRQYRTLGRSGLVVSPFGLGTMTFGAGRWGVAEPGARAILRAYAEAGGNFVDSADVYGGGESETMLGRLLREDGLRDRMVVATKSGFPRRDDTPLAGGNGARNMRDGIQSSLRRLQTDFIDLYWMHVWDRTTPAEEVLRALTDAVRRGEILYYGFSNTPAWYVARVSALAEAHGLPQPIGLQYPYSLIDRGVEQDLLPAGQHLGLGLVAWSPLAAGLLSGKYDRDRITDPAQAGALPNRGGETGATGSDGRLNGANPFGGALFTERNFDAVEVLRAVADELGRPMAQVALHWAAQRAGVSSVLVGASRPEQLRENLDALEIALSPAQRDALERAVPPPAAHSFANLALPRELVFGGHNVQPWRPAA